MKITKLAVAAMPETLTSAEIPTKLSTISIVLNDVKKLDGMAWPRITIYVDMRSIVCLMEFERANEMKIYHWMRS